MRSTLRAVRTYLIIPSLGHRARADDAAPALNQDRKSVIESTSAMLREFTTLDLIAVVVFFGTWIAYQVLFDGIWRRPNSVNALLFVMRREWMRQLLHRENRIVDSTLVGHTMHSAAFFASTTMLVLAGLIGVLGSADEVYTTGSDLSLLLSGGQRLFEFKMLLLIGIFIYAFFKFTWALRQYNYFCAVIGSAPPGNREGVDIEAYARRMAGVLTSAVRQINAGVRAYYFAFAAMGWFVHPYLLIGATVFMALILARRQLGSPMAKALQEHVKSLGSE
jgi:uncharacterized membrane protein